MSFRSSSDSVEKEAPNSENTLNAIFRGISLFARLRELNTSLNESSSPSRPDDEKFGLATLVLQTDGQLEDQSSVQQVVEEVCGLLSITEQPELTEVRQTIQNYGGFSSEINMLIEKNVIKTRLDEARNLLIQRPSDLTNSDLFAEFSLELQHRVEQTQQLLNS
jgi:hypothetical protein